MRKKQKLDEREEKLMNKVGTVSFYTMFFVCVAVIIAEIMWKGDLSTVLGETVVLLAGGIACLVGTLKNGIWSKSGRRATAGENLMWSVVMSGIFSVLYAAVLLRKGGEHALVAKWTVLFFLGIALLGFVCMTILGITSQKKKEKEEQKYAD